MNSTAPGRQAGGAGRSTGALGDHAEPGVTAVYDRHSYDTEKRDALDRWSARLEEILTKEPAVAAGG